MTTFSFGIWLTASDFGVELLRSENLRLGVNTSTIEDLIIAYPRHVIQ